MNIDFNAIFLERERASAISQTGHPTPYKCWFGGTAKNSNVEVRFKHYITFSKDCFSHNAAQQNISIFVDPKTDLPEWKVIAGNLDSTTIVEPLSFCLELSPQNCHESGSKIGGNPYYIRSAQAQLLQSKMQEMNLGFLLQLDEEDFFPAQTPGIDKYLRDSLCGGVIYVFAEIKTQASLISPDNFIVGHQI